MNSKNQSVMTIGIGLIIIGIVLLGYALSQPKILVSNSSSAATASSYAQTAQNAPNDDVITVTYPLNLNTCTYEELLSVEGIGESKASLILEYREYLGGYTSVEQLKDIKGIGDGIYEKIAPYFTV